jgi:hypothetical protein
MKSTIARFMLLAVLFAGSAFSQQSDQPANGVQQTASQADQGAQAPPGNDQANQPGNQAPSSSKKHKTKVKKEKKKKDKKPDQDSSSQPNN